MRIRWTIPAADDLESIKTYLLKSHPQFVEPTVQTIFSVTARKTERASLLARIEGARAPFPG